MLRAGQYKWLFFFAAALLAGFVGLGARCYAIQVTRFEELSAEGRRYTQYHRVLLPRRREILDRNGLRLVVSVPEKTVLLDPELCGPDVARVAETCGRLLKLSPAEITRAVEAAEKRAPGKHGAIVIKRHVPVAEWDAVSSALRLETFGLESGTLSRRDSQRLGAWRSRLLWATESEVRQYPYGSRLAQVLGIATPSDEGGSLVGQCGLELTYDETLRGRPGVCDSEQDAMGIELPARRVRYEPAVPGKDLRLTIDLPLQQAVEDLLSNTVSSAQADGGCAIVMDAASFEFLAIAGSPSFNPAAPGGSPMGNWSCPAFASRVEPGSVAKLFTLAAGLEYGLITLDSSVYCEQGAWRTGRVVLHDHSALGTVTFREGFVRSSNIAFGKLGQQLGAARLSQTLRSFGFGHAPEVRFAGAAVGLGLSPSEPSVEKLVQASFGQGIAVSPAQLAIAACAIAHGGTMCRPVLAREVEAGAGQAEIAAAPELPRRVISEATARQILEACKAVAAPGGTAESAMSPRFTFGAKTGTSQKSNEHGYRPGAYYSTIIGFLPADHPRLVILAALDEPKQGYYAGVVVSPLFRAIAERAAERLGIAPDKAPGAMVARSRPNSREDKP